MPLPWNLKPEYVKVEVDDATIFEVPIYASQLVDDAVFWAELKKDTAISAVSAAKQYVIHGLRLRKLVDESVPDEMLSSQLTIDLTGALFDLFFYGKSGKSQASESEGQTAKKKTQTGGRSTGSSSSTTQTSNSSVQKTLVAAQ